MPIPDFQALTTLETAQNKPFQQWLTRKIKDDFDSHQARIGGLDGIARTLSSSHFNREDFFGYKTNVTANGTVTLPAASHHVRIFADGDIGLSGGLIRTTLRANPRYLPFCKQRIRLSNWANAAYFAVGMMTDFTNAAGVTNGVFFTKDLDQLPVFICVDKGPESKLFPRVHVTNGDGTASPDMAALTNSQWYEVQIDFITEDIAECRLDGVLIHTFSRDLGDKLPGIVDSLYGVFQWQRLNFASTDNFDLDRMEFGEADEFDLT